MLNISNIRKGVYRKKVKKTGGLIAMIAHQLSLLILLFYLVLILVGAQVSYCWYFSVRSDCSYLGLAA